ncbi:MAG: hypothetical protein ABL888_06805 [Pirellulaceae bacterium]
MMNNQSAMQLESLSDENFIHRFEQISTTEGIYHALRRSIEVKTLNSALREELVGEQELDQFIRQLLTSFVAAEQFRFQMTLAGIVVACETINKSFARQFIDYVASIQLSELSVASMVARLVRRSITKTVAKTFSVSNLNQQVLMVQRLSRADVGQRSQTFETELV